MPATDASQVGPRLLDPRPEVSLGHVGPRFALLEPELLLAESSFQHDLLELLPVSPVDGRCGEGSVAAEGLVHEHNGEHPSDGGPAVDDGGAAGLEGAVDFLGAVQAAGAQEDDGDVHDVVVEEVVGEACLLGPLVRHLDGPLVGGRVRREDI